MCHKIFFFIFLFSTTGKYEKHFGCWCREAGHRLFGPSGHRLPANPCRLLSAGRSQRAFAARRFPAQNFSLIQRNRRPSHDLGAHYLASSSPPPALKVTTWPLTLPLASLLLLPKPRPPQGLGLALPLAGKLSLQRPAGHHFLQITPVRALLKPHYLKWCCTLPTM